jgi:hypothetical protein
MNAQVAADWFATKCASPIFYHCGIYDNGLCLCLCVGEEAAREWAIVLNTTEYAQSKDGMLWVFIVRGNPDELFAAAGALGATRHTDWEKHATFKDNRHMDDHLLDQWLALVRRVMDHA